MNTTISPGQRGGLRRASVLSWLRLARVYNKIEHCSAEQMRIKGLSTAQFDVMAHVGSEPGMTQQELADSLLVTKGNVCQLLDRMELSGLLERRQEGRSNRLYLTESGRRVYDDVVPSHEESISSHFAGLSGSEQTALLELLRKLDRSLE